MSSQAKVLLSGDNTNSVRVAHAATPALHTDNAVALVEHAKLDGLTNTPLETLVDIFLPVGASEVRLRLWKLERVDATVQMSISRGGSVSGDHDDWAYRTIL